MLSLAHGPSKQQSWPSTEACCLHCSGPRFRDAPLSVSLHFVINTPACPTTSACVYSAALLHSGFVFLSSLTSVRKLINRWGN